MKQLKLSRQLTGPRHILDGFRGKSRSKLLWPKPARSRLYLELIRWMASPSWREAKENLFVALVLVLAVNPTALCMLGSTLSYMPNKPSSFRTIRSP